MPDVFLSYSREDQATAQRFAGAFEAAGLSVWWDATLRSGESYDEVTEEALRSAKAVVVLWSPRSVVSRWVRAEATIADRNKTLTPVMIEPCERPVMFELTQTADLAHWRGAAEDPGWLAFLGDVNRRLGRETRLAAGAVSLSAITADDGRPVVAVLPLIPRAGEEGMDALAEDLTDEITRELALNPFFKVIAAGALATWRGKAIDYQALGRQLEANYLVEAKLQRAGDAVRLTAQLVEAATGGMLQSTRLSRKLSDIEASPDEFPGTVAAQLGQLVLQVEMNRAMTKRAPLSGWDHLLRARAYASRFGSDSSRKFIDEARSAAAALPNLSLAHAMLACALATDVLYDEFSTDLSHKIQAEIKDALQLGPDDPVIVGYLQSAYEGIGDGEACLRLGRRAVKLSPNSPRAQYLLARALNMLGRGADAIEAFREFDRLSPTDHAILGAYANLGMSHLLEGQWAEAEAAYDLSLAVQPDAPLPLQGKAVAAALQGKEQLAVATVRRLRDIEPQITLDQVLRPLIWHSRAAERLAEPVAVLRRLWAASEGDP
jgi:TolB-like protein/cytochrome c-type biogenesis protein CcmH/NrfG